MNKLAEKYIYRLQLKAHPEGGYFNEIYRSEEKTDQEHLPDRFNGPRCFSTSIYYLLEGNQFSTFHRLKSDEIWHFYDGSGITLYLLRNGRLETVVVGRNLDNGENLQFVIPRGSWFAAEINDKTSFSLVGCTVAPGFEFTDFEQGYYEPLSAEYPAFSELIKKFTPKGGFK